MKKSIYIYHNRKLKIMDKLRLDLELIKCDSGAKVTLGVLFDEISEFEKDCNRVNISVKSGVIDCLNLVYTLDLCYKVGVVSESYIMDFDIQNDIDYIGCGCPKGRISSSNDTVISAKLTQQYLNYCRNKSIGKI